MSELLQNKVTVLTRNNRSLICRNASHSVVTKIKSWLDDGTAIQINLPEKPFNRPAGGAYVGPGHGIDGSSYVHTWHGTTFDGCREFSIADNILTLRIFDGDNVDGMRRQLRDTWKFKLEFDWTDVTEFSKIIDLCWEYFIDDMFNDEEAIRIKEAKARIEKTLLTQ